MRADRNERIAAFYQREAAHLIANVSGQVRSADPALVEDACAEAWAILARRADIDPDSPTAFAWLAVVAVREGWRLYRDQTASAADVSDFERPDTGPSVEDIAANREALALLDELHPMQAQALRLKAAGLTMQEIADQLGKTYTWVNRHLTEGRKAIRELRGGE